jgi:hypothetical protein
LLRYQPEACVSSLKDLLAMAPGTG